MKNELIDYLSKIGIRNPERMCSILIPHFNHAKNYPSNESSLQHIFEKEEIDYIDNLFKAEAREEKLNHLFS